MNMIEKVTKSLSKFAGKSSLTLKKYSPEILLGVGIVGVVGTTVLACKATLKVEEVLDNHKEKKDKIDKCWDKVLNGEIPAEEYTLEHKKKDLTIVYAQTTIDLVKIYAPAVTTGIASIACIIAGFGIIKKRNVALIAAYKALEEGFASYRKRVIEEFGEKKDYMLRHGLKSEEVITEEKDEETGKVKKIKTERLVADNGSEVSVYAKFFDETSPAWSPNAEYNLYFLKAQEKYFNDLLRARGHVFLNEVYDALGIPRTQAGSVVGWVLNKNGDNYIDFGIFDNNRPRARAFVNGDERSILLDFNVDGVIYDLFTKEKV